MKKYILILFSICLFLILPCQSGEAADTKVYCDGELIEFSEGPHIIDGSTFVPVRGLSEALDFNYTWDSANRTVIITSEKLIAWVQADNQAISVNKNGVMYAEVVEAYPRIIDDRIFIPLRAISELFEAAVEWDGSTSSVIIKTSFADEDDDNESDKDYDDGSSYDQSDISISGFTPPKKVTKGSAFVLVGEIHSENELDRVNVKIIDTESEITEINETEFDIGNDVYSLADIDARITFGKLCAGEKILVITCVDEYDYKKAFEYEFIVHKPEGGKVDDDVAMIWPVPSSGLITTIFWCDNAFCHSNAGRENGHAAIDIAADQGADVVAVMDGVVKLQGFGNSENEKTGYGNFILLDHGNGLETQYAHLSEIYVTDGQVVEAGEVIGAIGSTGNSTGPHLDFYISQDGVRCDPLYYLDFHENVRCYEDCDLPFFEAALEERGITLK